MRDVFDAELWPWEPKRDEKTGEPTSKGSAWVFVTLPQELSDDIRDSVPRRAGFGSVRVVVKVGDTRWKTSVFPDSESGCYVLPVKKAVRTAERLELGDIATVDLEML